MATEEKKTNMNVRVSKSVRDRLAGIAQFAEREFSGVLESAMLDYIEKYEKAIKLDNALKRGGKG